eukprot:UN00621
MKCAHGADLMMKFVLYYLMYTRFDFMTGTKLTPTSRQP